MTSQMKSLRQICNQYGIDLKPDLLDRICKSLNQKVVQVTLLLYQFCLLRQRQNIDPISKRRTGFMKFIQLSNLEQCKAIVRSMSERDHSTFQLLVQYCIKIFKEHNIEDSALKETKIVKHSLNFLKEADDDVDSISSNLELLRIICRTGILQFLGFLIRGRIQYNRFFEILWSSGHNEFDGIFRSFNYLSIRIRFTLVCYRERL